MSFLRKKLRRSTSQSSTRSVSRMSTASDVEIDRLSMSSFVFDSGVKPWSEIVDKKKASKMSSSEKKRQQVLYELFTTEKSYLRDLYVIKKLFQKSVALDNCCTDEEIQTLFGNLDEVLLVNGELYESLKSRRHDGVCSHIGDIFISLLKESKFDVYIEFCAGQTEAIELYEHLNRNNSEFSQTMRTCEQKVEESGGFNLPAFLLKGMQRLLKYQPLLSQVLKSTPKEDLEYRQLQKAIELMNVCLNRFALCCFFFLHVALECSTRRLFRCFDSSSNSFEFIFFFLIGLCLCRVHCIDGIVLFLVCFLL
eukprot:m.50541 g.50541  ORF g.50541 m.50541 type:complete len:309 (-) comp10888_c0_seq7:27-953(-)